MGPRPHSERSSLPNESSNNISAEIIPTHLVAESPSPPTLSPATTPSPVPQEIIILENHADNVDVQEGVATDVSPLPCYPTPEDMMPYDHTLPDFIRQMTNQPNLANLHSLSLKVISRLVSLQRMSTYTPNLRELDLEGSMLTSLRDIGCNLKFLQVLKVGRCQLDSLDGTFGLTSLRELYAQKNQITDVSPCSNLPHIRHIDVSSNRIRNVSYAGFLSMCYKLKSIVFTGNPATEVPGYREHVRRILPQVEVLDNVPFLNDDNRNRSGSSELIENCNDMSSNTNSAEGSTSLVCKSPENVNNFFEPDEDPYSLAKYNAAARNNNQENYEATDYEVQEVLALGELQKDFDLLNIRMSEHESIRKLHENIDYSKQLNVDFDENDKKESVPDDNNDTSSLDGVNDLPENYSEPSSSFLSSSPTLQIMDCIENSDDGPSSSDAEKETKKGIKRPSTANVINCTPKSPEWDTKSGAIKKRPSTAAPRLILRDEDEEAEQSNIENGAGKLTTGAPICGNITAALRHRRKHLTAWAEDKEIVKTKKTEPLILMPKEKNELHNHPGASGDNADFNLPNENENNSPGEDVLATSKKWREAFLKFRSSNRARWEEEDEMDYSNLMGFEEQASNESFESDDVNDDK